MEASGYTARDRHGENRAAMIDFLGKVLDKLEALGIRTQKLRWKLYQWEKKREAMREHGTALPTRLQWLKYPHKFCLKCNALNDREARRCEKCGARLPSALGYKLFRLLGVVTPQGGAPTVVIFMVIMAGIFGASIIVQGPSGIMGPDTETLFRFGGWMPLMVNYPAQWWRILGFGLFHAGIIHIGFNLFALSQIGPLMENQVGRSRMLVLITVCQITAAAGSYIWYARVLGRPDIPTLGASGWVFGLIGFGIAYFHTGGPAVRVYRDVLVRWVIYMLVFGFLVGRVNNAAHIGGLVGGLLMGVIPEVHPRRSTALRYFWTAGFWVCLILWLITAVFLVHSIVANPLAQPG
jgi:rhomboid protease GluP